MTARTILVNASFAPSLLGFRGPLLRRMVAEGHRVHVSAPGLTGDIAAKLRAMGVTPHDVFMQRTGQNPLADFGYLRRLVALMRAQKFDLVLGYTIKPCVWGTLAARLAGVQSVSLVTGLGYAFIDSGSVRQSVVRRLSIALWRAATAANRVVIFQNSDDRDDFLAAGALADPAKARLVDGSGVDMADYPRTPLPPGARFLMIARLLGNKGVREYATAAARLIAGGTTARFALAGFFDEGPDGIPESEMADFERRGVEYLGPLLDVREALADCSVYVLPSYREGMPRTVLEAMASGRPVVTTDVPGCRQSIVEGASGFLVPPRDSDSLAEAMARLVEDPNLRETMGEAAYRRCAEVYAVDRVNDAMMAHLGLTSAV
jgi:glycosyltransferase involved in cell wall biosynthesis